VPATRTAPSTGWRLPPDPDSHRGFLDVVGAETYVVPV
jgi:hypothetical protein